MCFWCVWKTRLARDVYDDDGERAALAAAAVPAGVQTAERLAAVRGACEDVERREGASGRAGAWAQVCRLIRRPRRRRAAACSTLLPCPHAQPRARQQSQRATAARAQQAAPACSRPAAAARLDDAAPRRCRCQRRRAVRLGRVACFALRGVRRRRREARRVSAPCASPPSPSSPHPTMADRDNDGASLLPGTLLRAPP